MRVAATITLAVLLLTPTSAAASASGSPAVRSPRARASAVRVCHENKRPTSELGVEGRPFAYSTLIGCLQPGVKYSDPMLVWGDGSTSAAKIMHESQGAGEHAAASLTVTGKHTYAHTGNFNIAVELTEDQTGQTFKVEREEVTVFSISARALALSTHRNTSRGGVVAAFATNLWSTGLRAVIAWGDGRSSAGTIYSLNNELVVEGRHRWHRAKHYTLTVKLLSTTGRVLVSDVSHIWVHTRPAANEHLPASHVGSRHSPTGNCLQVGSPTDCRLTSVR